MLLDSCSPCSGCQRPENLLPAKGKKEAFPCRHASIDCTQAFFANQLLKKDPTPSPHGGLRSRFHLKKNYSETRLESKLSDIPNSENKQNSPGGPRSGTFSEPARISPGSLMLACCFLDKKNSGNDYPQQRGGILLLNTVATLPSLSNLLPFETFQNPPPLETSKTLQNHIKLWTPSNTSTTFQNPEFSNVRNLPREPVRKRLPELSLREPTCQHSGPPLSLILAETPKVLGKKVYVFSH